MNPVAAAGRTRARHFLGAFALAAVGDLGALLAGAGNLHALCKVLLMPLLAGYARERGAPAPLLGALALGWAGDVLLLSGAQPFFLAGMAAFAGGHVCYLLVFARLGERPTGWWARTALYALVLAAVLGVLWPALPAALRAPVAGYSALLTATALAAHRCGARAATGGALFLVSDFLIALGAAGLPQPPPAAPWIMLTYIAAQYLLVSGVLQGARARSGPALAYREKRTHI